MFDERPRFPGFFRVLPSFSRLPKALAMFSREMGWSQVAMITQDTPIWNAVGGTVWFKFLESSTHVGIPRCCITAYGRCSGCF